MGPKNSTIRGLPVYITAKLLSVASNFTYHRNGFGWGGGEPLRLTRVIL